MRKSGEGNVVMTERGIVGRVTSVGKNSAKVMLITDVLSKIPVRIYPAGERAIAAGKNDYYLNLLYLPEDHKVHEGDLVYTADDNEFLLAGIMVGTIKKSANNEGFVLVPSVNWSKITYVIVKNHKPPIVE
jgi:rod shape-determining protein MreC